MTHRPPNILFMIADDHRGSAIGGLDDPTVQTPTMDALIREGCAFRQAHMLGGMCGAVCVPTRAALHTGVNFFRACADPSDENYHGQLRLRPELPTLGETFRAAGYQTFATGKWHNDPAAFNRSFAAGRNLFFGGMSDQFRVPVSDYDPSGQYPREAQRIGAKHATELFSDTAIAFLQQHRTGQPFFLYVAFTSPHDPRTAPPAYHAMYPPDTIPLPPNFLPEHPFDNGELQVRDEKLAAFPRTPAEIRQHIADYYAMITHQDAQMGRLLAALEATGDAANTIVVYTGDHGLSVGQHGLLGKQNLYDHSVRVPLILRGPGIRAGRVSEALVHTYDLYPTLCELAGLRVPPTVESRSLRALLRGETTVGRPTLCAAYRLIQRMARDDRWKLIRYYHDAARGIGIDRTQLFDLANDPWETKDLSTDPVCQPHVSRLNTALREWQDAVGDPLASLDLPTARA